MGTRTNERTGDFGSDEYHSKEERKHEIDEWLWKAVASLSVPDSLLPFERVRSHSPFLLLAPKQPGQYENSPTKYLRQLIVQLRWAEENGGRRQRPTCVELYIQTVLPYLPRGFSKQRAWNTVLKPRHPPRPLLIEPSSIRAHTYLILAFHTNKLDKESIYIENTL